MCTRYGCLGCVSVDSIRPVQSVIDVKHCNGFVQAYVGLKHFVTLKETRAREVRQQQAKPLPQAGLAVELKSLNGRL